MRILALGIVLCSVLCTAQDNGVAKVGTGSELLDTCTRVSHVKATGNNLEEWMRDSSDVSTAFGACYGFIRAVKQLGEIGERTCPPEEVTYGQAQKIVIKYLNDHPETLHQSASVLVLKALSDAFPCPIKKPKSATGH